MLHGEAVSQNLSETERSEEGKDRTDTHTGPETDFTDLPAGKAELRCRNTSMFLINALRNGF